jgi:hypothetical protein
MESGVIIALAQCYGCATLHKKNHKTYFTSSPKKLKNNIDLQYLCTRTVNCPIFIKDGSLQWRVLLCCPTLNTKFAGSTFQREGRIWDYF